MKQIDKKDMPKLIALIALALGLFGFAAFQFLLPQAAPAAPAVAAKTDKAPIVSPVVGPAPGAAATIADLATVTLMETGRDPFLPSGPAAPKDPFALAPVAPAPVLPIAGSAAVNKANNLERLIGLANKGARPGGLADVMNQMNNGPGGAAGSAVAPFVLPAAPPPAYTLTGVVTSEGAGRFSRQSVAILRGGAGEMSERRFVKIGDEIGNGYRVTAIFAGGIDIKSGSRTITLNMGAPKTQNVNGVAQPASAVSAAGVSGNVINSSNGGAIVAAPGPASVAGAGK